MRADSTETAGLLRRALPLEVVEDVEAPANYSVRLARAAVDRKGQRELSLLYRSTCLALRARSPSDVLLALASELSGVAALGDGLVRVPAAAVVDRDGSATLILPGPLDELARQERALVQRGFRVLRSRFAALDPTSGDLVVSEPEIVLRGDGGGAVTYGGSTYRAAAVDVGSYSIGRWFFTRIAGGLDPVLRSTALRLAFAAAPVGEEVVARTRFAALVRSISGTSAVAAGSMDPAAVVHAVTAPPP